MNIKHTNRLNLLLQHLKSNNLELKNSELKEAKVINFIGNEKRVIHSLIYISIFREFDKIYSGFSNPDSDSQLIFNAIDYLGLSLDQFMHLFDLNKNQSIDKYGGVFLSIESGCSEIAFNIENMLKTE